MTPAMHAELVPVGDCAADERRAVADSSAEDVERRPRSPVAQDRQDGRRDGARTVVERQRDGVDIPGAMRNDETGESSAHCTVWRPRTGDPFLIVEEVERSGDGFLVRRARSDPKTHGYGARGRRRFRP